MASTVAVAALLAAAPPAGAASPAPLPPVVALAADGPLAPAGRARMTMWGFELYDAALWTAPGFRAGDFAAHPFVLDLAYLRNFSAADIARASLDQMRRHGPIDAGQARRWQDWLSATLPDVRKGDRLAGVHRPGRGLAFFHNGRSLGELQDPEFARLFFAIWLGEATSAPALRRALLAGATP